MEILWYCLLAILLTGYVVLDGYDLGVGILHLHLAKLESERMETLGAIAPFWDANEVWLIAAGGTFLMAFPRAFAAAFSGFYLPLNMVLWLLIVRGMSIEFRNHIKSPVWTPLWDSLFWFSSLLLALFFGVALGNLIRGLPIDSNGDFFLPLWTDLTTRGELGAIDWFTASTGLLAVLALALHGAFWLNFRTRGSVQRRASRIALRLAGVTAVLSLLITALTFRMAPRAVSNLKAAQWGAAFPLLAFMALGTAVIWMKRGRALMAFGASSLFLIGLLGSAAFALFPYLLPAMEGKNGGITIYNSSAADSSLWTGLFWWIPGMLLAVGYSVFSHRHFTAGNNLGTREH